MITAILLSPWQLIPGDPLPLIAPAFTQTHTVQCLRDITGQPAASLLPDPNLAAFETRLERAAYEALAADPTIYVLSAHAD